MSGKLYLSLVVWALTLSLAACGSTHQVDKTPEYSVSESGVILDTPKAPIQPVNPFYTGNGGKGISIAILAPKAAGFFVGLLDLFYDKDKLLTKG